MNAKLIWTANIIKKPVNLCYFIKKKMEKSTELSPKAVLLAKPT